MPVHLIASSQNDTVNGYRTAAVGPYDAVIGKFLDDRFNDDSTGQDPARKLVVDGALAPEGSYMRLENTCYQSANNV